MALSQTDHDATSYQNSNKEWCRPCHKLLVIMFLNGIPSLYSFLPYLRETKNVKDEIIFSQVLTSKNFVSEITNEAAPNGSRLLLCDENRCLKSVSTSII